MSGAHLEHLDRLIALTRGAIAELRGAAPVDLQDFTEAHAAAFAALAALGDVQRADPTLPICEARLAELERLTGALRADVGGARAALRRRLEQLERGRRGVDGYARTVRGQRGRGGEHGPA